MLPRFLFSLMMRTSISVTLQAIEVADRAQIDLRTGQEGASAEDVDGQASLDAIDDPRLDRSLIVEGLLDLIPGVQALRLLVREVDVALFGVTGLAHNRDLVAALHGDVAFVVLEFRDRNHALGLVADVDHHILRRDFQHGAGDDLLFVERGFGLSLFLLKGFQSGGEIFHGGFFFRPGSGRGSRLDGSRAGIGSWFGMLLSRLRVRGRSGLHFRLGVRLLSGLRFALLGSAGFLGLGGRGVVGFFERHVGCVRTLAQIENAQRA